MNVLRRIARVNRREQWDNHITNDNIRENLGVTSVEEAARVSRLRWFWHVERMRDDRLPKRILSAVVPGVIGRGRSRRRFMDTVRSALEVISLAQDRIAWRGMVHH